MRPHQYPGNVYIITAPSGTGKTTLYRRLLAEHPTIYFSVSYTTRDARAGERAGRDYHFVDVPTFKAMIANEDFLEWARVHEHYYGTAKADIFTRLERGTDVLLDVDVAGAAQVKRLVPGAVGIFILPPDYETLRARLTERGQDRPEVIATRLRNARAEVRHAVEFDFILVNGDFDTCYRELETLLAADRLRTDRRREEFGKILESFASAD